MRIVLDASAGVAVATKLPSAERLSEILAKADLVISPHLFIAEVSNAFWKYHHLQSLPKPEALRGMNIAIDLIDQFYPLESMAFESFHLACSTHLSVYDSFYLNLCLRTACGLATLDKALRKAAKLQGIEIIGEGS